MENAIQNSIHHSFEPSLPFQSFLVQNFFLLAQFCRSKTHFHPIDELFACENSYPSLMTNSRSILRQFWITKRPWKFLNQLIDSNARSLHVHRKINCRLEKVSRAQKCPRFSVSMTTDVRRWPATINVDDIRHERHSAFPMFVAIMTHILYIINQYHQVQKIFPTRSWLKCFKSQTGHFFSNGFNFENVVWRPRNSDILSTSFCFNILS